MDSSHANILFMANTLFPAAKLNKVHHGDCLAAMKALPDGCVDLAFADPPFNIGYDYDVYDDRREHAHYLKWSKDWIAAVHRVLKPDGTFWLAIGDDYAAELKIASQDAGFHCRSWVIWYYTFGVNCKQKFSRSHTHLFHFVKDPQKFTFRADDLDNRVYSARQLVYADNRGNPNGRLPDDTWILRPQDLQDCFTAEEDTWYFPRVAGTFKERAGFHGCQMPEQLLGRIIRVCSEEREVVLDPFSGSATTLVVSKKLGRNFVGFELSEDYVTRSSSRLDGVAVGDRLEGAPEPLVSAPLTRNGKSLADAPGERNRRKAETLALQVPTDHEVNRSRTLFDKGLLEAFRQINDGYSLDRVIADPDLNTALSEQCRLLGLPGEPRIWNHHLFNMRKRGQLAEIPTSRKTNIDWKVCDEFLFASEIAWKRMIDKGHKSLDEILCDPQLASEFDSIAASFAPNFVPLQYRWAALKLRKTVKDARTRAKLLGDRKTLHLADNFGEPLQAFNSAWKAVPEKSGIYLVTRRDDKQSLYLGEALNLKGRLRTQFGSSPAKKAWQTHCDTSNLSVQLFTAEVGFTDLIAYQSILVSRYRPLLNSENLAAV